MIAERIKLLRENSKLSQAQLAKELGITRSSVNAWEMGISVPSTQYMVELSKFFGVSTDFLFGLSSDTMLNVDGLTPEDVQMVQLLILHLKRKYQSKPPV